MTNLSLKIFVTLLLLQVGFSVRGQMPDQTYYLDGDPLNPQATGYYRNGLKDSIWVYRGKHGTDSTGHYSKGIKIGKWWQKEGLYYCAEGLYLNGAKQGKWEYFTDGGRMGMRKVAQGVFDHGKKQGTWWEYQLGGLVMEGRYENGLREGQWALAWETGDSVGFFNYKDGKLDGKFKHWQPGFYRMEGEFCNGKPCGEWVYGYPSGITFEKVIHRPEKQDSLIIERFLPTGEQTISDGHGTYLNVREGVRILEGKVANGMREGTFIHRSIEGDTTAIETYARGKLNGTRYGYDYKDTIVIYTTVEYLAGRRHGKSTSFQNDSTPPSESEYNNGLLHGKKKIWGGLEEKVLIIEAEYINGKASGKWIRRYFNGSTKYEKKYRNGYLIDTLKWYFEDGSMQRQAYFDSTKHLWKISYWDEKGRLYQQFFSNDTLCEFTELVPDQTSAPGDSMYKSTIKIWFETRCDTFRSWYSNGQLKYLWPYDDGESNGTLLKWDSLGNLVSSSEMEKGKSQGIWKEYYQNGQVKRQENRVRGHLEGARREWYPSGNRKSEMFFSYGLADSLFQYWDNDGNLLVKGNLESGKLVGEWKFFIDGYEKAVDYTGNAQGLNARFQYPDGTLFYQQKINDSITLLHGALFYPNGKPWLEFSRSLVEDFLMNYWTKNHQQKVINGNGAFKATIEKGKKIKVKVQNGRINFAIQVPDLFPGILRDERWEFLEKLIESSAKYYKWDWDHLFYN